MKPNVLWVIEEKTLDDTWKPTWDACSTRSEARQCLTLWEDEWPLEDFRVTKYVSTQVVVPPTKTTSAP